MENGLPHFITDGYTLPFYVDGIPRAFPALRGKFRPLLPAARQAYADFEDSNPPSAEKSRRKLEIMAAQLTEWNAREADGTPAKIDAAHLARLPGPIHDRLFWIVFGLEASDIDPQANGEQPEAAADREAADAKN